MEQFKHNMQQMHGDKAITWLDNLPTVIEQLASQYALENLSPVDNMTYNYVTTAIQDASPVVLKVGMDESALAREAACLAAYKANGVVKVLAHGPGHLIMQQALPGTTLKLYYPDRDEDAVSICCEVIHRLSKATVPTDAQFQDLTILLRALDSDCDVPMAILNKARTLRDQLLASSTKNILLHGDLHHDNILQNGNEWLAIDPKGFVGDIAFEPAAFLANPIPELIKHSQLNTIIKKRIDTFANQLSLDRQRIRDWFFVKSVLCWCWSLADDVDPSHWKELVDKLDTL